MKKIIALTLIFILSLSNSVFANTDIVKDDLTKYGIITDYEISGINRAEAAKILVSMMGINEVQRADTEFTDVPAQYWASGYIHLAQAMGIINGHGDGTFAPEEPLTNEQMVKMLVCVLGYSESVHVPYPTGHYTKATQIGVLEGLDLKGSDIAKRSDVAIMVHNSLDIPMMVQTGFGSVNEYSIMDGKNGTPKRTLRSELDDMIADSQAHESEKESDVPRFNGPEYMSALVKVSNLTEKFKNISFENGLKKNDKTKYIIDENTYIYISPNTIPLEEITNGCYIQCWHMADEKDNIKLLKVEIMKEEPQMAN